MFSFIDIFCGAGGSSTGLVNAGWQLKLAANHWQRAIETHAANHPDAEHLCADVSNYPMRNLPRADNLWASPICTEVSPAGGKKKSRGQMDLLADLNEEGYVAPAALDRTRATFHDVIRATEVHRFKYVLVENVVNVATEWELFDWWVQGMCQLRPGYSVQFVSVSSAHIGDETNQPAPQWRDRLYMAFTRKDMPVPDLQPRPYAYCGTCDEVVRAVQSWKKPDRRPIGAYGKQYVYRCPNTRCRHSVVEPYVLPAAAALDLGNLGTPIGERKDRLSPNTLRRIAVGMEMFGDPTIIAAGGNTYERPSSDYVRAWPALTAPLNARTKTGGDGVAIPPFMTPAGGTWNDEPAPVLDAPMRTRTTRETDGLATPPGAFYTKHYGGHADPRHMSKPLTHPLGTITASGGNHALVVPYRRGSTAYRAGEAPLSTVATRAQHGVSDLREMPKVSARDLPRKLTDDQARELADRLADVRFRMLKAEEHLAAQRFPSDYVVLGTEREKTHQGGNAVSVNVPQWIAGQINKANASVAV
ncbi:DNA cytosine methyltransferase [Saccharothrix hoggarensis]|uniref:DNA (cytosine-5-)-methyltransferase n=1 Tax=Saccharothrix hoggarensis TaxID=913853 RepID=A0ABW3QMM0_9PSEU